MILYHNYQEAEMKRTTIATITLIVLLQLIGITSDAIGSYWVTDGSDIIELERNDHLLHSPWHEVGQGSYGYWVTTSQWQQVLDFSQTNPLISPFTWTNVSWIPSSMDWNGGVYLILPETIEHPDVTPYELAPSSVECLMASLDSSPIVRNQCSPCFVASLEADVI